MQQLQPNTTLQGGKYRILRTLGQGGFGITYLATQVNLNREVAVKEFFMKDLCNRDDETHLMTAVSSGVKDTVDRYLAKFHKEAKNIASLSHPNIVRIIDVFEENDTAYYVMEYMENGSLADKVKSEGRLSETAATQYIRQVADALSYVHHQKIVHLDVKPANIMLSNRGDAVLIDFGLAKQYDAATDGQTSSTPVGISEGYAPKEQYKLGGVATFSPEADIYALGATFFKLLTGVTPPSALDVDEDGLPIEELAKWDVSDKAVAVISHAMQPSKKNRFASVDDFIASLSEGGRPLKKQPEKNGGKKAPDTEETLPFASSASHKPLSAGGQKPVEEESNNKKKISIKTFLISGIVGVVATVGVIFGIRQSDNAPEEWVVDTTVTEYVYEDTDVLPFEVNGVTFNMVRVPAGTFTMGATSEQEEPWDIKKPAHRVTLTSDYWMGATEVTQALWKAVMGSNPSRYKGDERPVERVSWNDCQDFLAELNRITGKRFRLPTEAEWEYAARGGSSSRGYQYAGSNNPDEVAWYDDNSGDGTHPVGQKAPNELGLYDMSGNVWEWCQDWYGSYSSGSQTDPTGPSSGSYRVLRGGSWLSRAGGCRSSFRNYYAPGHRYSNFGFRLVLSE